MKFLAGSVLFLVLICSCGSPVDSGEPTEISEERKGQMDAIREKLGRIEANLPIEDYELIGDSSIIEGLKNEVSNGIQLFSIDRPLLVDIVNGGKNIAKLKKNKTAWLYSGNWGALSVDPIEEGLMYDSRLRSIIDEINNAKYIVVTEDVYYSSGEVEGKTILKSASAGIWMWLIDMESEQIVRAVYMEDTSGDTVYSSQSNSAALDSNLETSLRMKINALINMWGGADNHTNFQSSI